MTVRTGLLIVAAWGGVCLFALCLMRSGSDADAQAEWEAALLRYRPDFPIRGDRTVELCERAGWNKGETWE